MENIKELKAEIFDLIYEQELLKIKIAQMEEIKKQKLIELNKLSEEQKAGE